MMNSVRLKRTQLIADKGRVTPSFSAPVELNDIQKERLNALLAEILTDKAGKEGEYNEIT